MDSLRGKLKSIIILAGIVLMAAGCGTMPVKKIGLLSPFEGVARNDGYRRLYGVKLALREINRGGGLDGYKFELVALNDFSRADEAILQAKEFVIDSDVIGVIGEWDTDIFAATAPIFDAAQLRAFAPSRFTDFSTLPPNFAADYQSLAGMPPDAQAKQAYLATRKLFRTIDRAIRQHPRLTRAALYDLP